MYGLEAINCANGWAMASVGATIVISGLSVLSFLISQFHHLVSFFEKEKKSSEINRNKKNEKFTKNNIPTKLPDKIDEVFEIYLLFTNNKLGNSFKLTDLYKISNNIGLPHPYISIRNFRDAGILIPLGEGRFSWKSTSK